MVTVRKTVTLTKDNIEWLEEVYGRDSLSWALDMLLQEFRKAHTHTPQHYALLGAMELTKQVEEKGK
jgi:hypothetical protein